MIHNIFDLVECVGPKIVAVDSNIKDFAQRFGFFAGGGQTIMAVAHKAPTPPVFFIPNHQGIMAQNYGVGGSRVLDCYFVIGGIAKNIGRAVLFNVLRNCGMVVVARQTM